MSHSILGIRLPKYFQECLLKFTFAKMSFEEAKNINTRPRFQSVLSVEKHRDLHGLVPASSPTSCVLLLYLPTVSRSLLFLSHKQHKLSLARWSSPVFVWLVHFYPSDSALMPLPQKSLPWSFHLFCYCSHTSPFPLLSFFELILFLPEYELYHIFSCLFVNCPIAIRAGITSVLLTII